MKLRFTIIFILYVWTVFAQTPFIDQVITDNSLVASQPTVVISADLDGDNDNDILALAYIYGNLVWYENEDGVGTFSTKKILASNNSTKTVETSDLDGDGDLDILSTYGFDGTIGWLENIDGMANFGDINIISDSIKGTNSLNISDLDGDGDMDIAVSAATEIGEDIFGWYENIDGNGTFGSLQILDFDLIFDPVKITSSDVDGDGDLDLLGSTFYELVLFENVDGNGSFTSSTLISNEIFEGVLATADIDSDGDLDVISSSSEFNAVVWFENNGMGDFLSPQISTLSDTKIISAIPADLDGDGDLDIACNERFSDGFSWFENTDGLGTLERNFITTELYNYEINTVLPVDLNGSGDLDILTSSFNNSKIGWHENETGNGIFSDQKIISQTKTTHPVSITSADLDGDSDLEIICASEFDNKISWFENLNGQGNFSDQIIVTQYENHPVFVRAADIDQDGDQDLITASERNGKIAWYENLDGLGSFGTTKIVSADVSGLTSLFTSDIDNDGDLDVLSTSNIEDEINWYENLDGEGVFGQRNIIDDSESYESVTAIDIDGDGDQDVLPRSSSLDHLKWFENVDDMGTFSNAHLVSINTGKYSGIAAGDFDNDGDIDIAFALRVPSTITDYFIGWYENKLDDGANWEKHILYEINISVEDLITTDIDNDNDLDLVLSGRGTDTPEIIIFENEDGAATFGSHQVLAESQVGHVSDISSGDLDGDGKNDILYALPLQDKVAWLENTITVSSEIPTSEIAIYPVPVSIVLNVKSEHQIQSITVFSSTGQLVSSNNNKNHIDLSSLEGGVYFCELKDDKGQSYTSKVIKQ